MHQGQLDLRVVKVQLVAQAIKVLQVTLAHREHRVPKVQQVLQELWEALDLQEQQVHLGSLVCQEQQVLWVQ